MIQSGLLAAALFAAAPVDFDTEVLPILTKAGCNSGACHGAAAGRGGFKLSLFAGDPAADHRAIARELEGRRVNVAHPDQSLILAKPIGNLDHEGGMLFDSDSPQAQRIAQWIGEGAERLALRKIVNLRLRPSEVFLADMQSAIQLNASAEFDDGSSRDVTDLMIFTVADPASVVVDERGKMKVLRKGWHTVAARFLTELLTVQVTVPLSDQPLDTSTHPTGNWVDDFVHQQLEALRIPASPQADDATLLRRARLDLTGRLPTTDELHSYLADKRVDNYERLVDQLLASDEFVDYWTYRLERWLQLPIYAVRGDRVGAETYHVWLRSQIAREVGWDQIVRDLLLATGDSHQVGPANFHRQANDARAEAELVATSLLGVELRCANCHNHPLDRWTQDDYHGLAAIFARLERNQTVLVKPRGEVTHPATGTPAQPRLPGEGELDENGDARAALAQWITAGDNPYFARSFVNRLWKELMGRGLVEPTDAIRPTNPASHPALLAKLADELVTQRFRLRPMIRTIVLSAAYRRSSQVLQSNREDLHFYSHALAKPLSPEVYVDAVSDVIELQQNTPDAVSRSRSIQLVDAFARAQGVAAVNGCSAGESCLPADTLAGDLATRLQLLNGEFLNTKLQDERGYLATRIAQRATDEQIVTELYERALCRAPSKDELGYWSQQLGGSKAGRVGKLQDFCWSLLNCREFVTNH